MLAGLVFVAEAGRVPRTEEVEVEPEVVLPVEETEDKAKQVRQPIYMPAMPMLYRQSAQAPVFQYVPVPDPRFISLGAGGYANLGLISAGGNFGVDANQGTFNAGAGAGLGQNFANYGQQGVTSLPRIVDPRFISLGGGAFANLGLISAGGNFGVDANQGTFNAGAGAGLGQNFAQYGQQGVTSLPRTVPAPNAPYVPPTPKVVVFF